MGKRSLWAIFLGTVLALSACVRPSSTYVLFASDAREDADMEKQPSIRLPLKDQPVGAIIRCYDGTMITAVMKLGDELVRIRDPDGKERVVKMPGQGIPVGLSVFWRNKEAVRCGIDPASPVGTYAFWMWRQLLVRMRKLDAGKTMYIFGDEDLILGDFLSDQDRRELIENTLPEGFVAHMQ